ncbi:MAG: FtsQ-type POTRA domain-containing protein [Acidimicrobiia bacterium]|nr:FtsQ-type POTRA domain-containing protein [Acidimicrobiia bacterium]MDH5288850.1 FtsQ-type POTRA domain-containing protein [Acidimicrobiia bacterium]
MTATRRNASRTADVAPSRGQGSRTVDAVRPRTGGTPAATGEERPRPRRDPDPVDPRLRARRHQVARQEGRRRLRLIAAVTLAATVAIVAIAAANSSLLDVERVTVSGASRANPQQVVVATGLQIGQPLIEVRPAHVAAAVERVPWIDTARIHRGWRGDVTVAVTERRAVLAMPTGIRFALVDPTGRQLEIVDGPPEGMLVLAGLEASGVPGQAVPGEALAAVVSLERLSPEIAAHTTGLSVQGGQVFLELGPIGRAEIGDDRDLEAKMVALETVLARVDLTCVSVIDVRVPSAPTVRRAGLVGGQLAASGADSEEPLASTGGC